MDIQEIQVRLELLRLAKDITEVNSLNNQAPAGSAHRQMLPRYSVDEVLVTARRLYEFVTAEETEKTAV